MTVGAKIKQARDRKGFSQEQMADILQISQSKYSRIEKDETKLAIDEIPILAEELDLNILDLLNIAHGKIININTKSNVGGYVENQNNTNTELLDEIKQLYEKLLQAKDETIHHLKELLK